MNKKYGKIMATAASVLCASVIMLGNPISVLAATGTVTSSNVKVRSEASTTAQQVSSLDSGDKVDIIDEATDSQGYVWYRIYVNDHEFGYVRSDLVSKSGSTSTSTSTKTEAASLPETQVTAVESQAATITVASANVRSGAGTAYSTVGTVANGDGVTITGEATGTDNKKWYQISFGSNGRTGFVRSDLLQIGAPAPAESTDAPAEVTENPEGEQPAEEGAAPEEGAEGAEGEVAEAPAEEAAAPAVVGNGEFSLDYKDDGTGTETWYLYDNVQSTQVKLNDLLNYATLGQKTAGLEEQVKKLKITLIVLALIIAALVFAVLILIYKLRDYAYYEDEEEEEAPARRKDSYDDLPSKKGYKKSSEKSDKNGSYKSLGRTVADSKERTETVTPSRDRKAAPMGTAKSLMPERKSSYNRSSDAVDRVSVKADRAEAPKPSSQPRKSRNFLLEDDDFEFEFLDLDDEK
ncbi:MAG: SH3 domain-containing protein [Butyrivibrio sp.]|nr:SH3 domain-containing protein [Butyrivibrio sp.]